MRILICNWKDLAHPRSGGAEVWTHGVARAWASEGHDVTIACAAAPGHPDEEVVDGVEIARGGDYRFGVHRHARRLYERRGGRFDLVVDEVNTRPFGAPRWARHSDVVAVIHQVAREIWFHETPLPVALAGRYAFEPRWLRPYRDVRTYVGSVSGADSLRMYGLRNIVVLPQGSALGDARHYPKEPHPTFAFVGRLSSAKRPSHVIDAFRTYSRSRPDARLWVMGTGPEEHRLRRMAGAGIEVLGHVSRAERDERMGRAHYLLATSVREGWGLVVSEAAAVGTATIAYGVPGLVDSVPAAGGMLVEPRPDALAAAMEAATADLAAVGRPASHGTVPWEVVAARLLGDVREELAVA